jgi:hypothetical protein
MIFPQGHIGLSGAAMIDVDNQVTKVNWPG